MSSEEDRKLVYNTPRWKALREKILDKSGGLCVECEKKGLTREAVIVHHRKPWKEGRNESERNALIWDENNLEAVCIPCHNVLHFGMCETNKESNEIENLAYELLGITSY